MAHVKFIIVWKAEMERLLTGLPEANNLFRQSDERSCCFLLSKHTVLYQTNREAGGHMASGFSLSQCRRQ